MAENTAPELQSEIHAAMAGAPVDPAPGTGPVAPAPVPVDPVEGWRAYTNLATQLLSKLLLPQWNISEEERFELTMALAQILALHFPDGIDGKYAGYFRLLACGSVIVATRAAAGGGKLPGIGPRRAEKPAADAPQAH